MKIFSIDPNSGKYFEDNTKFVNNDSNLYQGTYNYTPIYPLYTFQTSGRFNYDNQNPEIEFITMLPIRKFFKKYLVEFRWRFIIDNSEINSINIAFKEFKKACELYKKTIDINSLI